MGNHPLDHRGDRNYTKWEDMKKLLAALLLLSVSLLTPPVWVEKQVAPWVTWSAQGTVDLLHPALTRLWTSDGRFACTGFYVNQEAGHQLRGIILTAGHCAGTAYARRNAELWVSYPVNWRAVLDGHPAFQKTIDVAVGTSIVPEELPLGKRFWLANKIEPGRVYIPGFPMGIERISTGVAVGPSDEYPGSWVVQMERAGEVTYGSSGSPVLREDGRVVGIVWGGRTGQSDGFTNIVFVTPIDVVYDLLKLLEK